MGIDQSSGIDLEGTGRIRRDVKAALVTLDVQGITEQEAAHFAPMNPIRFGNNCIEHFA